MMAAMMIVCNPGDKVIVFSPFYENYAADAILSGAEPIYVPLKPPLFDFDINKLEAAFAQHPKALICAILPTRREKSFPRMSCGSLRGLRKSMTLSSLPTKCMNTLSMNRSVIPISPHCPVCLSEPYRAVRFPKPIPSPAGDSGI